MAEIELLPAEEWPRFARTMVTVWRRHYLAKGKELTVSVWPGRWPADGPDEVAGARVLQSEDIGGDSAMMVLGRAYGRWVAVYQLASVLWRGVPARDLEVACAFMDLDQHGQPRAWFAPDPHTGTPSPVFTLPGHQW